MKRTLIALACLVTALGATGAARADLTVGVADDGGKLALDHGAWFLAQMKQAGLQENRITLGWDSERPTTIAEKDRLDAYLANAAAAGIRVMILISPNRARALSDSAAARADFVRFVAQVARTYPQIKEIGVGNEPNQPRFWQPQFSFSGKNLSCSAYERVLASAYDALKAVDPAITVIGVSLSPRGNDNALAAVNASTSPIRCIRELGLAYRASGRTKPIMDELAFHPHPNSYTDGYRVGYRWPNAGTSNLGRIKQAMWDAFNRTGQPIFAEAGKPVFKAALPPLRVRLNEVGWQVSVPAASLHAYYGRESVTRLADERFQADNYAALIPYYACDASIRSMLYYGLVDEPDLDRWQAGLIRADETRRPSFAAVQSALSRGLARCNRRPTTWRHTTKVVGPSARFGERRRSASDTRWSFAASSEEAATFRAAMYRLKSRRFSVAQRKKLAAAVGRRKTPKPVFSARGRSRAHAGAFVRFPRRKLAPGTYVFAIRLTSEMNPARQSVLVSKPFAVGSKKTRRR